jgi:hypothetical protein
MSGCVTQMIKSLDEVGDRSLRVSCLEKALERVAGRRVFKSGDRTESAAKAIGPLGQCQRQSPPS